MPTVSQKTSVCLYLLCYLKDAVFRDGSLVTSIRLMQVFICNRTLSDCKIRNCCVRYSR